MNPFDEIHVAFPSYPVYKSYFIRRRNGNNLYWVRELKTEDVNKLLKVLSSLRSFLESSLRLAEKIGGVNLEYERIELIGDLIGFFLKAPLMGDPLPYVAPSPSKMYPVARLLYNQIRENLNDIFSFTKTLYDRENVFGPFSKAGIMDILSNYSLSEDIISCWFDIPADTRPGMNSSGLIPHLLATSALAWCIAVSHGCSREDAAEIRLAAMLHDMGKPLNYKDHVNASIKVANGLLKGLVDNNRLSRVTDLIRTHHEKDKEEGVIHLADIDATSIDRISELVRSNIGSKLSEMAEALGIDVDITSWKFWENLYAGRDRLKEAGLIDDEPIREISELFVSSIYSKTRCYTTYPKDFETSKKEVPYASIILADVGNIQRFIYSAEELRCLVAGSILVDALVMAYLPLKIQLKLLAKRGVWLPYEAFILTSGGVVEIIAPRKLEEDVKSAVNEVGRMTKEHGLPISCVSSTLDYSLKRIRDELAKAIIVSKHTPQTNTAQINQIGVSKGVRKLCETCYTRRPELVRNIHGEDKNLCRTCNELYDIGSDMHFKVKFESEMGFVGEIKEAPYHIFNMKWSEGGEITASKYIMELIAGHDYDELVKIERGEMEKRDIAVVKADGNLIGPFMATTISLTDSIERSARIDMAMKKAVKSAVEEAYKELKNSGYSDEAKRTVARIHLGTIYVGGDDMLMLIPSWIAPMLCRNIAAEFSLELGIARGLSIGLVSAPVTSSIWSMIDAASGLLGKAKKACRERYRKQQDPSSLNTGYICFSNINTTFFSQAVVEDMLNAFLDMGISSQPYDVTQDGGSFNDLLTLLIPEGSSEYKTAYQVSRGGSHDSREKRLLKALLTSMNDAIVTGRDLASRMSVEKYENVITLAFTHKQLSRSIEGGIAEETSQAYQKLLEIMFMSRDGKIGSALADAMHMIKIMGGGYL